MRGSCRLHGHRPFRARAAPAARASLPSIRGINDAGKQGQEASGGRRGVLLSFLAGIPALQSLPVSALVPLQPAKIQLELAPDQSKYDASDPDLRAAGQLVQDALAAPDVQQEEALWTRIINEYSGMDRPWAPDVVGRAYGNRGNARSRQGKLDEAITDFNRSIEICPWSVDPVLNRGVALEAQGRFEEAIADYKEILLANTQDPAGWNNLGNAYAGLGHWEEAVEYYGKAAMLAPQYAGAVGNEALALFQVGRTDEAIRRMRSLLRRYPEYPDMRAALTAALWSIGKEGDAETNWGRVSDVRYGDMDWLKSKRRWPPKAQASLQAFLELRSVP